MNDLAKAIGQRIGNYRTQRGLSQERLPGFQGVTRHISVSRRTEKRTQSRRTEKRLRRLCRNFRNPELKFKFV